MAAVVSEADSDARTERLALAYMVSSPERMRAGLNLLRDGDVTVPAYQDVLAALRECAAHGVDPTADAMEQMGVNDATCALVGELAAQPPEVGSSDLVLRQVRAAGMARKLRATIDAMRQRGFRVRGDVDGALSRIAMVDDLS